MLFSSTRLNLHRKRKLFYFLANQRYVCSLSPSHVIVELACLVLGAKLVINSCRLLHVQLTLLLSHNIKSKLFLSVGWLGKNISTSYAVTEKPTAFPHTKVVFDCGTGGTNPHRTGELYYSFTITVSSFFVVARLDDSNSLLIILKYVCVCCKHYLEIFHCQRAVQHLKHFRELYSARYMLTVL